ncbi:MAG: DUF4935 domain-containing protein [Candidatus Thiodiazotropha sp. (ex Clathrolucina costata)]|nr:DUF4935 domain-containing protein [Candidatus Thiodiazotropha taylori]
MNSIVLDTNILHQEGFSSRNMRLLLRLVKASFVEIFIPDLVRREFVTKRILEAKENLKKSHDQLSLIIKKNTHDLRFQRIIEDAKQNIKLAESKIDDQIITGFDNWKDDFKINIVPFESDKIHQVIDEYFLGAGVYKKPKSREDIPDAMINTCITHLLKKKGALIVVLKDGAFKKYLQTVENISIFDSLSEFLDTKEVQQKINELDAQIENAEGIKQYLIESEFSNNLRSYFISKTEEIEDIYLEESDISNKDRLEIDSFGERVEYVRAGNIKDVKVMKPASLSENIFSLDIEFTTDATIYYCGQYVDYLELGMDDTRDVSLDSMSDGLCDLSETKSLRFSGLLEIRIPSDIDMDAVKEYTKNLDSKDNPINLHLQVYSAKIL